MPRLAQLIDNGDFMRLIPMTTALTLDLGDRYLADPVAYPSNSLRACCFKGCDTLAETKSAMRLAVDREQGYEPVADRNDALSSMALPVKRIEVLHHHRVHFCIVGGSGVIDKHKGNFLLG